jgi:helix-hairpin-helix protein
MAAIKDFVANTAWLWYILLAILLLAAIWWAFRRESTERASIESEESTHDGRKASSDDLTKIEGIGPKVERVLNEAGITTFDALAKADAGEVQKALNEAGLQMMNPEGWIEQASLAEKGDWEGLEKLQDELEGGRRK